MNRLVLRNKIQTPAAVILSEAAPVLRRRVEGPLLVSIDPDIKTFFDPYLK